MKKKTWIFILLAVLACVGTALVFIYRHAVLAAVKDEEEEASAVQDQPEDAPEEAAA